MIVVRIVGAVALVLLSAQAAVLEAFYVPLRVGGVPFPVSVVAAVVLNVLLPAAVYAVTGTRWAAALPAVAWLLVLVVLAMGRPEGDLIVPGSWPGLALLFLGAIASAFGVGRIIAQLPPRVAQAHR